MPYTVTHKFEGSFIQNVRQLVVNVSQYIHYSLNVFYQNVITCNHYLFLRLLIRLAPHIVLLLHAILRLYLLLLPLLLLLLLLCMLSLLLLLLILANLSLVLLLLLISGWIDCLVGIGGLWALLPWWLWIVFGLILTWLFLTNLRLILREAELLIIGSLSLVNISSTWFSNLLAEYSLFRVVLGGSGYFDVSVCVISSSTGCTLV
jgi:hypothetical protein